MISKKLMMINIWSVVQAYAFFTEYFEKIGGKEKLFMSNVFFFFYLWNIIWRWWSVNSELKHNTLYVKFQITPSPLCIENQKSRWTDFKCALNWRENRISIFGGIVFTGIDE